jgi:hypothetical protein
MSAARVDVRQRTYREFGLRIGALQVRHFTFWLGVRSNYLRGTIGFVSSTNNDSEPSGARERTARSGTYRGVVL